MGSRCVYIWMDVFIYRGMCLYIDGWGSLYIFPSLWKGRIYTPSARIHNHTPSLGMSWRRTRERKTVASPQNPPHHRIPPPPTATMVRQHPPTALPPYEPPYIPLSASHLQKLGSLVDGGGRQTALDKLLATLAQAFDTLGVAVSDLGELVPVGKDDHDDEQAANQALLDELDVMARSLVDSTHRATLMKAGLATVVAAFRDEARRDAGEDVHDLTSIADERDGVVGRVGERLRTDMRDYDKLSMVARCGAGGVLFFIFFLLCTQVNG